MSREGGKEREREKRSGGCSGGRVCGWLGGSRLKVECKRDVWQLKDELTEFGERRPSLKPQKPYVTARDYSLG